MTARRHLTAFAVLLAATIGPAELRSSTVIPGIENPTEIGSATLNFFGFTVYRGRLFTEDGRAFTPGEPVALELVYNRNFTAEQMLDTTRSELARVEPGREGQDALVETLAGCFRDVGRGDQFLAASESPDRLRLWLNGALTCDVEGDEIGKRFLSIWLSENSRFPRLSRQLRGA
ncbi:MAG: chalcone isomerase family protein [Alkalilacustris sp.]